MLLLCPSSLLLSTPLKPYRAASSEINLESNIPKSIPLSNPNKKSWVSCSSTYQGKFMAFRPPPTPELGLLSLCFVLSLAFASVFSLAVVSIPTVRAFRRLGASMDLLLRVVKQEVPGTLLSIRLSAHEINDLTQQLSKLRQRGRVKTSENKGMNN